jgi:hypothetical protein
VRFAPPRTALLLLSLVVAGPAGAYAQRAAEVDDFLGITRCADGEAVTELRGDVRDSLLLAEVQAHEEVHRRQAAEFGSCEAFLASVTTARRIIDLELPAYCAQWRLAIARGADSAVTRREYAWRIAAQSGAMENRLSVVQRFERECT